jgi:hypothetical protein
VFVIEKKITKLSDKPNNSCYWLFAFSYFWAKVKKRAIVQTATPRVAQHTKH